MIEVIKRSNKKLKSIEFSYKETVKDIDATNYAGEIGKLPFVVINGVNIESKDIKYFRLYNDKFLPELDMIFTDPTNKIFDSYYPLDQQIISVLIKSNESLLMSIRMDFWVTEFKSVKNKEGDSDKKIYTLHSELNVPYIIKNNSNRGTSYEVLQDIAELADLGFASNMNGTNDNMTWINCGIDYIREQVPEIVKRAYIDDNTFVWSYIDFWYNLNYIDIEKQLNISTQYDEGLIGLSLSLDSEKNDTIPLILSNHPNYSATNQYIKKFNLINNSTEVNHELGYKPHVYYYDIKENIINNFLLDPISTKGANNDKIVMKGQPDDNDYGLNQQKNYFLGKSDTDNSHKNYLYAEYNNDHNLEFLQKIRMSITIENSNFQLYRFQPVKIELYKLLELDDNSNPITSQEAVTKNVDKYKLNERLSGDWLIIGINYTFMSGKGKDQMVQEITVARRELGASKIDKNE
jgi:hypothetical protein